MFPTTKGFGIWVLPGQRITSYQQIAEGVSWVEWGVEKTPNKKTIKDVVDWLAQEGMIIIESNAHGTVISIMNWGIYNCLESAESNAGETHHGQRSGLPSGHKEEEERIKEELKKNKVKRFVPPSVEEVTEYCRERKNNIDPQKFVDHYTTRNWVPKGYTQQMKDWKAAVRTWEGPDNGRGINRHSGSTKETGRKAGFVEANGPDADWLGVGER